MAGGASPRATGAETRRQLGRSLVPRRRPQLAPVSATLAGNREPAAACRAADPEAREAQLPPDG